jgi:hypothetical protein
MRYGQSTTRVRNRRYILNAANNRILVYLSLLKSELLVMVYASRIPPHEAVEKRKLQSYYTARPQEETKTR